MQTRTRVAIAISIVLNAILFAAGVVVVFSLANHFERSELFMPILMLASVVLTPIVASKLASYFCERIALYTRTHTHKH